MSEPVIPPPSALPEVVEVAGVRKFGDAQLQAQLEAIYDRLPDKKRALQVGVTLDDQKTVAVFAVVKLDEWSIMGALNKPWNKPITAQVVGGWSK